jgi:hypothetical protein
MFRIFRYICVCVCIVYINSSCLGIRRIYNIRPSPFSIFIQTPECINSEVPKARALALTVVLPRDGILEQQF